MGKLNHWTQKQDQLIKQQFPKFKSRKWKNISQTLQKCGFNRGQAQCRQRYVNHLDPILDKDQLISQEQLQLLYDKYQLHGPKWCLIQTFLPQRTQIRIKNIFYGNVRLFLKKLYKFFTKKTAVFINELKTDDLQTIYDGAQEFSGFDLIKNAFRKVSYKINQQTCNQIISAKRKQYFYLLNKILEYKTKVRPLQKNYCISDGQECELKSYQKQELLILDKPQIKQNDDIQKKQTNNKNQNFASKTEILQTQTPVTVLPFEFINPSIFQSSKNINFVFDFPFCLNSYFNGFEYQNINNVLNYFNKDQMYQQISPSLIPYYIQLSKINQNRFSNFQNNNNS